ncbi:uncharacterized protein LOC131054794 isoform X2 [Cryptomeria japonica]|uniref:uncharacterized protein LOC131054794 isoform X2 n=1 Tax=Cryptomeria japonica TaxID=3369 RepID=UPI0025AD43E1|nr:uncharacterized protein LOC131054794 isoform X2 [Cryptomeria japonica]
MEARGTGDRYVDRAAAPWSCGRQESLLLLPKWRWARETEERTREILSIEGCKTELHYSAPRGQLTRALYRKKKWIPDLEQVNQPDSRLMRSAIVVESASCRWKPIEAQKRRSVSIFASGMRNPSFEQINRISAELKPHGVVEVYSGACRNYFLCSPARLFSLFV